MTSLVCQPSSSFICESILGSRCPHWMIGRLWMNEVIGNPITLHKIWLCVRHVPLLCVDLLHLIDFFIEVELSSSVTYWNSRRHPMVNRFGTQLLVKVILCRAFARAWRRHVFVMFDRRTQSLARMEHDRTSGSDEPDVHLDGARQMSGFFFRQDDTARWRPPSLPRNRHMCLIRLVASASPISSFSKHEVKRYRKISPGEPEKFTERWSNPTYHRLQKGPPSSGTKMVEFWFLRTCKICMALWIC